jgi:serine/threonine protein kinase
MNFSSKYIASGSYGCVIKPGYNCDNNNFPLNKTVSKLFSDKNEWNYEIKQNRKISEIDKLNTFTVKMLNSCEISKKYINNNVKNISKCSIIEYDENIYQIVYEDGGYDLRELFSHNELFERFPDFNIRDFLLKLRNIFDGLYKIELLGLCHRDIKLDNLLFNGDKISLIDFGLMEKKAELFNDDNLHIYIRSNIYYYPNEIKLYGIKKLKLSFNNMRLNSLNLIEMLEEFILNNKKITSNQLYLNEIRKIIEKIRKDTYEYLEFFKKTKHNFDLKRFEKIDVYLLGVVLIEVLAYIAIYLPITLIKQEFFVLVSQMLEIDPYKRISMLEAKDLYGQIINN